jgi:hypothetical protein
VRGSRQIGDVAEPWVHVVQNYLSSSLACSTSTPNSGHTRREAVFVNGRRSWALAIPAASLVVAGTLWHVSGGGEPRGCDSIQSQQLARFRAELKRVLPEAEVRERVNGCGHGADAQLIARAPGLAGPSGLLVLTETFDEAGWKRTIGLQRRAPADPDFVTFRYVGTSLVQDRPIDILLQKVGYRPEPIDWY